MVEVGNFADCISWTVLSAPVTAMRDVAQPDYCVEYA